ncbi:PREDICTED: uncharacterized protein LOC105562201 [Vollenhovia emeryi]|uniref:uncharacterized protein LOC105562201 n=1 Tax=Vollenhovia emeryi TaxID=411798 RepID=UPI0005F3A5DF|nr:PREDICTED: uncharacterized protein LOC105562201 [Vollenhovia emeryi]XP_011868231.1 PREDICTED: uncharacterized protein LOC105562201 [Vollenhovia emeryi]
MQALNVFLLLALIGSVCGNPIFFDEDATLESDSLPKLGLPPQMVQRSLRYPSSASSPSSEVGFLSGLSPQMQFLEYLVCEIIPQLISYTDPNSSLPAIINSVCNSISYEYIAR